MASMNKRKQHHAQRRAATKLRLSFMFLDIFLGTFVVGIVLMTTLGRPASDAPLDGSGGLTFIEVEYEWQEGQVVLAPLVWYGKCALHAQGLATNFTPNAYKTVWPGYRRASGQIELPTALHHGLWQDGFYTDNEALILQRGGNRIGHLLISDPIPGAWSFAVRVVERPATLRSEDALIKGRMTIRWGGVETDATTEKLTVEFGNQSSIQAILAQQTIEAPLLARGNNTMGVAKLTITGTPQVEGCGNL